MELYQNGEISQEALQEAGYTWDGENWDKAAQMQAIQKTWPVIASFFLGQGFKPRDVTDIELDRMWNERMALQKRKGEMTADAYSEAWDALDKKYPYMDVFVMARDRDPKDRLSSFYWLVKGRVPPGEKG